LWLRFDWRDCASAAPARKRWQPKRDAIQFDALVHQPFQGTAQEFHHIDAGVFDLFGTRGFLIVFFAGLFVLGLLGFLSLLSFRFLLLGILGLFFLSVGRRLLTILFFRGLLFLLLLLVFSVLFRRLDTLLEFGLLLRGWLFGAVAAAGQPFLEIAALDRRNEYVGERKEGEQKGSHEDQYGLRLHTHGVCSIF